MPDNTRSGQNGTKRISRFRTDSYIPAVLYKYSPPINARYIGACSLRFSPPAAFNDPFDGLPDTKATRAMAGYGQALEEARKKAQMMLGVREARKIMPIVVELAMIGAIKRLQQDLDNFRILCLSKCSPETMAAALMMGHYCNSHTGFVYEFATDHVWVRSHYGTSDRSRAMGPVKYRSRRPSIPYDGRHALFVKSSDWSYEREYRLVRNVRQSANELIGAGRDIACFPPKMLKAITLCCNASKGIENKVRSQLESNRKLRHVRLFKLSVEPDRYRFHKKEIPSTILGVRSIASIRENTLELARRADTRRAQTTSLISSKGSPQNC